MIVSLGFQLLLVAGGYDSWAQSTLIQASVGLIDPLFSVPEKEFCALFLRPPVDVSKKRCGAFLTIRSGGFPMGFATSRRRKDEIFASSSHHLRFISPQYPSDPHCCWYLLVKSCELPYLLLPPCLPFFGEHHLRWCDRRKRCGSWRWSWDSFRKGPYIYVYIYICTDTRGTLHVYICKIRVCM